MSTTTKTKPEKAAKAASEKVSNKAPKVVSDAEAVTAPTVSPKGGKKAAKVTTDSEVSGEQKPNVDSKSIAKAGQKPEGVGSEEDVASPAAMKLQKWQEIRVILERIKEDTLREIYKSVKNGTDAVAANEPGGDIYDQASSERDRELGLLLGDREREKLHSIDEALLRIDEDEYGICEECDEDIPLGRLKAMPFTRHCVKCKSDLEKLQAQTKRFEEDRAYREIPLGSEEEES